MKHLLMLLMVLVLGCGQKPLNKIDAELSPFYKSFIAEANAYGRPLSLEQDMIIQFGTLGQKNGLGSVIGQCDHLSRGSSTITVDRKSWEVLDQDSRLLLLYHELGHCLLGQQHTNESLDIMNPIINNPKAGMPGYLPNMLKSMFDRNS